MTNPANCSNLLQIVRRFARERHANAAIEFAIIVPVLAVMAVTISDASSVAIGASHMETALRSSVQYAMNGGTDMSQAQAVGVQAWQGKPHGATLNVTSVCECGAGAGICNQICPDGSLPQTFVSAVASAPLGGSVIHLQKSLSETVRVH
jgi:Flp pilus assembly pilin Flp